MTYEEKTAEALKGRTIEKADVTGHYVEITCTDGTVFHYSASDGGYSCWGVTLPDGSRMT